MAVCTINGQQRQLAAGMNVADLLDEMHLHGRKIAVEKNGEIVPKSQRNCELLQDGDVIEIVAAVGGG